MQFDKAHVEGITALQAADIRYAEQLGYRIKLLGITKRREHGIELRVHPTLIPAKRLIANVEGAMNAVVVQGDAVGTTLYYGKGAGAEPTASAVVADLVDITRLHTADPDHRVPHLAFQRGAMQDTPILPIDEVVTAFYLRLQVADEKGVLARITGILAENDISIDAVLQRESAEGEKQTDLIILTHDTVEGRMNDGAGADAGAADGAGADRAHPQGRAELKYISTRGDATPRPLLRDPARRPGARRRAVPAAGLSAGRRRHAGALARPVLCRAGLRDPVAVHRRHSGRRPARAGAAHLHGRGLRHARRSRR